MNHARRLLFGAAVSMQLLLACGAQSPTRPPPATTDHDDGGAVAIESGLHDAAPADTSVRTDSGGLTDDDAAADGAIVPSASTLRVVAYLPNYSGSYADWAKSIDFSKMTHLNLAFATANGANAWDLGASDGDVTALVEAAHAAGVLVLASLGGGGGDQTVLAQYENAANVAPLVANLDALVTRLDLDGVDVDIEDPSHLGDDYSTFVTAVVAALRPKGKLVTAAVAQYLQDSMHDETLASFDFVNVMIYSSYADSVSAMTYYATTKSMPAGKLTLGAGFFGSDSAGNEYAYKDILAADASAWSKDSATVNGQTVNYTGVASMKKLADHSKSYGGIMFWELSEDAPGAHSLYAAIQGEM